MNRLTALKYFIVAADTLNFRQTAEHFAVSPQVITRVISELENELEETLFKRNTRSIRLTDFGLAFLPRAEYFLKEEEKLFGLSKTDHKELTGTVRITLPPFVDNNQILHRLLTELEPYPNIAIDWRAEFDLMKAVEDNIDIGIRICREPEPHWVARKLFDVEESIVASPKLLAKMGKPENVTDLVKNYPISALLNTKTGRPWHLLINNEEIPLVQTHFLSADPSSLLTATLAGRTFASITLRECRAYLENGELVEVFPCHLHGWAYYLYRPYQAITPQRVLLVFDLLEKILKESHE